MAIIGLNISNKAVEAIMHMEKSQEKTAPRGMGKKKEYRRTPTFVNLKSNTMKNTMQR